MGYKIESACNDCPECVGCGRRFRKYKVLYCDDCGDEVEELYEHKGEELCWECYKEKFTQMICDECDDTLCAECGKEADILYQIEGNEWTCEDCLKDMAERIEE